MRLSLGLEQRQVQKQILAPRMIQSMEILQLPLQALEERIEQEMNENPLLEMRDADPTLPDEPSERDNPDAPTVEERELVVDEKSNSEDDFERLLDLDREVPDYFDERPSRSLASILDDGDRKQDAMANVIDRHSSLQHHLELQLCELELTAPVQRFAVRIISALDSNGYLPSSLADLLPPHADDEQRLVAEEALAVVQSLDPAGIGARDLRECLLLQLRPDMPFYLELRRLVGEHLEDMGENRLPLVQRKTGYSIERIQEVWQELRHLNPKPGAAFAESTAPIVTPDLCVERQDDGSYKVVMDENQMPQLRISKYYRQRLQSGEATAEEKEFIRRKVNAAQWLIESIQQRRTTLTRVTQAIIDYQTRFLEDGPEHIEPLKMQQIADQVGIHVTTVSRAVDDKWIQTPRGIFPLRRFFVGGTTNAEGEDVAWDAIRIKLQEIVDHEDKTKPYSDEELMEQLAAHGLTVARRTVTKYRKKMHIASSRQRRDWSKAAAAAADESDSAED
ncbi:MAG: RNA polymerase factor sigma-54 [Planctomycetales bacterium]|nr:RNA polymerase factor sigma-54 [Planctomycetales bacterium]